MAQFQMMEENIQMLQIRLRKMTDYIKPVLRAIFLNVPLPADPAAELGAVLDRCRRLWPRLQHFIKQVGTFVA